MSPEENMHWKQKEEQDNKQVEEWKEKIEKMEEELLADGPYTDQIVINDENTEFSASEEIETLTDETYEDSITFKNSSLLVTESDLKSKDQSDTIEDEDGKDKKKPAERENKEQLSDNLTEDAISERERRMENLEHLETALVNQVKFIEQEIVWENESQKEKIERLSFDNREQVDEKSGESDQYVVHSREPSKQVKILHKREEFEEQKRNKTSVNGNKIRDQERVSHEKSNNTDTKPREKKDQINSIQREKEILSNMNSFVASRSVVKSLITTIDKIERNFGINGSSPAYKPSKSLILIYDNSNEGKLRIKAESSSDEDLGHFLIEGFGLTSKSEIKKGAFWFGKIVNSSKGKFHNEWHRFSQFLSLRSEKKIEGKDGWILSKNAVGWVTTKRRRIIVEIDRTSLMEVKKGLIENAIKLANDPSHEKWINQSGADARRNKNPEASLKRLVEKIECWDNYNNLNYKLYKQNLRKKEMETIKLEESSFKSEIYDTHPPTTSPDIKVRQNLLEKGKVLLRTGEDSDLVEFTQMWNEFVSNKGKLTLNIWKAYNEIQESLEKALVLYKLNDNEQMFFISPVGYLYSQIEEMNLSAKKILNLLDYFLIQNDEKEGVRPFFEIEIKNPDTGNMELIWIPNEVPKPWNTYKGFGREFYNRSVGGTMKRLFATKEVLTTEDIEYYNEIEHSLRKKYPKLGLQKQVRSTTLGGQTILFKSVYKVNYSKNSIKEALELVFWRKTETDFFTNNFNLIERFGVSQKTIIFSNLGHQPRIAGNIVEINNNGSLTYNDWSDKLALSMKAANSDFIIFQTDDKKINGLYAPSLIQTIREYLIQGDKSIIKSGGRMFNNLLKIMEDRTLFRMGNCYWENLFPLNTNLNNFGIPKQYHLTIVYQKGINTNTRWINLFRGEFLIPMSEWLESSGLSNRVRTILVKNPESNNVYKKKFNNISSLLKYHSGLGKWENQKWQGSYADLYVLKYGTEYIKVCLKQVCDSIDLHSRNRTGKDKAKIINFFKNKSEIKIFNPIPENQNHKFLVTLSSRDETLSNLYNKIIKDNPTGSKLVRSYLSSIIGSCKLLPIDPWTVQEAIDRKFLKKAPKNLLSLLKEEGDGPINSFCAGLFLSIDFRENSNIMNRVQFSVDLFKYPKKSQKFIIAQSIKSGRLADTYGKSFTTVSIPDVVTDYSKASGSTELFFIKVVNNDLVSSFEGAITEILKSNCDKEDHFRPFPATIFLHSDLSILSNTSDNQKKILLLLQKYNADGVINIEIPDLRTIGLSRFGEIWATVRNEYVEKRNFNKSRKIYLKNPEKFTDLLIQRVTKKINRFQKLNPVSSETVKKGLQLIDFETTTRTKFVQNTFRRYLEYINTNSYTET